MLNKWYYSNLAVRTDKVHAQELVASIQRFPPSVLTRFPVAIETTEMPDTLAELCLLMNRDGFTEWTADRLSHSDLSLTWVAANWTKLKMLRHVANSDAGAVITTDNAYPIVPFELISQTISACPSDLKALYLHWVAEPDEGGFKREHYESLAGLTPCGITGVLANFHGVGWIVYFTPSGAQHFLDVWRQEPPTDGQYIPLACRYWWNHPLQLSGTYACNPHLALSIFDLGRIHKNEQIFSASNPLKIKDK